MERHPGSRLDPRTQEVLISLQHRLYRDFKGRPISEALIHEMGGRIRAYFSFLRHIGRWVPHFDLYIGVCPFDPTRIEIYDYQEYHYIFPASRMPKMAVRVTI